MFWWWVWQAGCRDAGSFSQGCRSGFQTDLVVTDQVSWFPALCLVSGSSVTIQNHYRASWCLAVLGSSSEEPCKCCKDTRLLLDSSLFCTSLIGSDSTESPFLPSFLLFHPHSYLSDSFQSELWEPRVFPLKDEEVEALLCQYQVTNQTEVPSAAFPSDSPCTSCTAAGWPDNGHPPRKQPTEESEDCETLCPGINTTRKRKWQGIMWFIKKAN